MFQSEQEEFYHLHRDKFPEDFSSSIEKYLELKELFYETEPAFRNTINPPLIRLMIEQFPSLGSSTDTQQKKHMADINKFLSFSLIWRMFFMLRDQKDNIDLHSKYPKLESWREFYCRPAKPQQVQDSWRQPLLHKTEQEWQQFKEEENKKILQYHFEEEAKRQAFYDIVQPLLFDALPGLQNIEGDHWVIYAMLLGDQYDQWDSFSGRIETIIDYQLPVESFYWENKDFHKALRGKMRK